jgi:hypothetical protein
VSARKALPLPDGGSELEAALARRLERSGPTDTPAAPPVPQEPAQRRAAGKRATTPPPEPVPEIDDTALLSRWRWQLGATARKAAATRSKAEAAMVDWERLARDAHNAGVPPRLTVAAAADAGMDI